MVLEVSGGLFGKHTDEGRAGKQKYLSLPASAFITAAPATDDCIYNAVRLLANSGFPNLFY